MHRSFNVTAFKEAAVPYPDILPLSFDYEGWLNNKKNVMLQEGENVGLFTYEYPGVYNAHYFMADRGREAIRISIKGFKTIFDEYGGEVLRGLTRANLKAARWMARQLGLKSYGVIEYPDGPHELFIVTKNEFYDFLEGKNNG